MASIFAHLLETMPFTIAVEHARTQSGQRTGDLPLSYLSPNLRALAKTGVHRIPTPRVPPAPAPLTAENVAVSGGVAALPAPLSELLEENSALGARILTPGYSRRRLWDFEHDGGTPHRVRNVTCRVRETGYKNMQVLDELLFGFEESNTFQPQVRVVLEGGTNLDLPLSATYLHSRWAVTGGHIAEGSSTLYPLEAHLDNAVVLAFAYELGSGGAFHAYQPPEGDVGELAIEELRGSSPVDTESNRWMTRAKTGDFMPSGEETAARAGVGGSADVSIAPPRILVMLSFAVMRERADFEPGGIVGMGRAYPHVLIKASVPVKSKHAAVKFTRPSASTELDAGDGTVVGTCCEAGSTIGSLLVADANENPWGPDNAFKGYWSGTFSYVEVDPNTRLHDHVLNVVRRDKPTTRTVTGCGRRDLPDMPPMFDLTDIEKRPRQGEFDNIHVSPRLRLRATELQAMGLTGRYWAPITSRSAMRLDDIVMAPFCAHDCFHQHWRWSPNSNMVAGINLWSKGWAVGGNPHSEEGVPLTPPNHDVQLVVHAPNVWTYLEHALPTHDPAEDATGTIAARRTEIFCYAGAAFAQGIVTWRHVTATVIDANMAVVRIDSTARLFRDAAGTELRPFSNSPALYWTMRFYAEESSAGVWEAKEYLQISNADIDRARWY